MANEQSKPDMMPISPAERSRTYHYRNGGTLKVEGVNAICVRPSGTHRLQTQAGQLWIVAAGWDAIQIDADGWSL